MKLPVTAALLTLAMSFTSLAGEPNWLVSQNLSRQQYEEMYGAPDWYRAEGVAQVRAWAKANVGDIASLPNQHLQYGAIVNKVTSFLTYDLRYLYPVIAYTIRDGRGVCGDFVALTAGLCDEVGIDYTPVIGMYDGAYHGLLIVTVDGQCYYSDPTGVYSGATKALSTTLTPGFVPTQMESGLCSIVGRTGYSPQL